MPAVARNLHARLLERIEKAEKISETSPYNFIIGDGSLGIICNGVSYNYVYDAVQDLKLEGLAKILRIGFSNPMPRALIKNFLKGCEKVLVVEEGEAYMEEAIKAFAQEEGLTFSIKGKEENLFSRLYEFNPRLVRQCIAKYFNLNHTPVEIPDLSDIPEIPQRPPNLCPGCSHRATFYAVKKAAEGMTTICPTDIGCYTLGFLPPFPWEIFCYVWDLLSEHPADFQKSRIKKSSPLSVIPPSFIREYPVWSMRFLINTILP